MFRCASANVWTISQLQLCETKDGFNRVEEKNQLPNFLNINREKTHVDQCEASFVESNLHYLSVFVCKCCLYICLLKYQQKKLRNKSCWSVEASFVKSNLHYKDGMIYALATGCRVAAFYQLFRPKTEINHAVANLAKIWHHMWHRGHKCNCFGDLSVAGSRLWSITNVHYSYTRTNT